MLVKVTHKKSKYVYFYSVKGIIQNTLYTKVLKLIRLNEAINHSSSLSQLSDRYSETRPILERGTFFLPLEYR